MSNMKIKIVATEVQRAKTKTGKDYEFVEVTYKNLSFDGKVESKKHNQYGDKTVFNTLKDASPGDEIVIQRKKDDAGYWQWVGIGEGDAAPATNKPTGGVVTASNPAPKSNWETPEERAKKQLYIVRQSSIGHAIETLKTDKKSPSVDEVLHVAKIYEQYVFGVNLDADLPKVEKMPYFEDEDIPV